MLELDKTNLSHLTTCFDVKELKWYVSKLAENNIECFFDSEPLGDMPTHNRIGSRDIELWVKTIDFEKAYEVYGQVSGYDEKVDVEISNYLVSESIHENEPKLVSEKDSNEGGISRKTLIILLVCVLGLLIFIISWGLHFSNFNENKPKIMDRKDSVLLKESNELNKLYNNKYFEHN
jgi:hypothetical protein